MLLPPLGGSRFGFVELEVGALGNVTFGGALVEAPAAVRARHVVRVF